MNDPTEGAMIGWPDSLAESPAQLVPISRVSDRNAIQDQYRAPVWPDSGNSYDTGSVAESQPQGGGYYFFPYYFELQPHVVEYQPQDAANDYLNLSASFRIPQGQDDGFLAAVNDFSEAEWDKPLQSLSSVNSLPVGAVGVGEPTVGSSFELPTPESSSELPTPELSSELPTPESSFELQTPESFLELQTFALASGAPTPQSQAAENLAPIAREPSPSRPNRRNPRAKVCSHPGCNFSTANKIQRHELTHRPLTRYACQCGTYSNPRKDTIQRHMATCSKKRQNNYACQTHGSFTDRQQFLAHMENCGPRRGRLRGVAAAVHVGGAAEWEG